jgi:hypothetical protein
MAPGEGIFIITGRLTGRGCHPDRQEDFPPPRGRSPGVPEAEGAPGISTG